MIFHRLKIKVSIFQNDIFWLWFFPNKFLVLIILIFRMSHIINHRVLAHTFFVVVCGYLVHLTIVRLRLPLWHPATETCRGRSGSEPDNKHIKAYHTCLNLQDWERDSYLCAPEWAEGIPYKQIKVYLRLW